METILIGVTVVVLAVNFMGAIFAREIDDLLQYGAGIALPIAALGLFVGLRAWSVKINKETENSINKPIEAKSWELTSKEAPDND